MVKSRTDKGVKIRESSGTGAFLVRAAVVFVLLFSFIPDASSNPVKQASKGDGVAMLDILVNSSRYESSQLFKIQRSFLINADPKEAGFVAQSIVEKNLELFHELAFDLAQRSSRQGFAPSMFLLYRMYHEGIVVKSNERKAKSWLKKASRAGHQEAVSILQEELKQAQSQENPKYQEVLKEAAQGGLATAQLNLARNLLQSDKEEDLKKANQWLKEASKKEDLEAKFLLARNQLLGIGQEQSRHEALIQLMSLTEQKHLTASYFLGIQYESGEVLAQDLKRSRELYELAAQGGHVQAQFNLAMLLRSINPGSKEAIAWLKSASDKGLVEASYNLARAYEKGLGVSRDDKLAFDLYQSAEKAGIREASLALALLLIRGGKDIEKNPALGVRKISQMALEGQPQACLNLGILYENGYGVKLDYDKARHWYTRASKLGLKQGEERLSELKRKQGLFYRIKTWVQGWFQ